MIDVAVTGPFAGDLHRLSIDAVMPGVRQLEKDAGSVLRGLKNKKKMAPGQSGLPAMMNFPAGMAMGYFAMMLIWHGSRSCRVCYACAVMVKRW